MASIAEWSGQQTASCMQALRRRRLPARSGRLAACLAGWLPAQPWHRCVSLGPNLILNWNHGTINIERCVGQGGGWVGGRTQLPLQPPGGAAFAAIASLVLCFLGS